MNTPSRACPRPGSKHRPAYNQIVEYIRSQGKRNYDFTAKLINIPGYELIPMVVAGIIKRVGKTAKTNRNIYRLTYNLEKEE